MNKLMKKFFTSSLITSTLLILLGGLLIFQSELTLISISFIIGGILVGLGILALFRFIINFRNNKFNELYVVYGMVTIILGILVISNPKALVSIIPFVLGICIVISSSAKLQYAFELKKNENRLWIMTMVVALLSTICGVVLIFNPFKGANMIMQIIGIFIVIYAVLDIISTITIKRNIASIQSAIESNIKDAVVIEETDENDSNNIDDKKIKNSKKKNKK